MGNRVKRTIDSEEGQRERERGGGVREGER